MKLFNPAEQLLIKADYLRWCADAPRVGIRIVRLGKRYFKRQNVTGGEARINVQQPLEAADGQPGADQQHQSQGHFADHQSRAEVFAATTIGGASSFFEGVVQS